MAQPHRAGRRALDFLREDGFRFEGVVDLLDGGPAVVAPSRMIKTIRESFEAPLRPAAVDDEVALAAYVAVGSGSDFRCLRTYVSMDADGSFRCAPADFSAFAEVDQLVGRIRLADEGQIAGQRLKPPASNLPPYDRRDHAAERTPSREKLITP
jgi:hypothetical protein